MVSSTSSLTIRSPGIVSENPERISINVLPEEIILKIIFCTSTLGELRQQLQAFSLVSKTFHRIASDIPSEMLSQLILLEKIESILLPLIKTGDNKKIIHQALLSQTRLFSSADANRSIGVLINQDSIRLPINETQFGILDDSSAYIGFYKRGAELDNNILLLEDEEDNTVGCLLGPTHEDTIELYFNDGATLQKQCKNAFLLSTSPSQWTEVVKKLQENTV